MKKKLLYIFIMLFFLVNYYGVPVSAQSDVFLIDDVSNYSGESNFRVGWNNGINFNVDSNGDYFVFQIEGQSQYNVTMWKSTDDGDTWASSRLFNLSSGNRSYYGMCTTIDDNNVVHMVYAQRDIGATTNMRYCYRTYDTDTTSLSSEEVIRHYGEGFTNRGMLILANDDSDVLFAYASDTGKAGYSIFDDQIGAWGDFNSLDDDATGNYDVGSKGLCGDILTNGSFVVGGFDDNLWFHIIGVEHSSALGEDCWLIDKQLMEGASNVEDGDLAIDSNDNIHFLVSNESSYKFNYFVYNDANGTTQKDVFTDMVAGRDPDVSINTDGTVQLLWTDDTGGTPTHYVMGYYGNVHSWSDLQLYQSNSASNTHVVRTPYQNLQSFTHTTDGIVAVAYNTTDDTLIHLDEGYSIFSGGGFGYCVANYSYFTTDYGAPAIKDLTTTTIDFALPSFSEGVTVRCLEMDVDEDQLTTISDDVSDYLLYINGEACGNPDQVDYANTKLIWYDLSVNVGDDDLVFEVVCGAGVYVGDTIYYWLDLPLDQDGNAYYSAYDSDEIGNGVVDGTPMFSYMERGLDMHISYDVTGYAEECNTITMSLLSEVNLTAYEYLRLDIDIDGADISELFIYNNDTGVNEGGSYLTGDQHTTWKWLVMPQNVETGNHSVRIAEIGCTDYVWVEFYINLTGFTEGDWDLRLSDSSVQAGTPFNIDFKAPDGETANISIATGYEVFPSIWLGKFAGTGAWVNDSTQYTPFQKCRVFLINDTSGEIMKFIEVNIYGETDNLLVVQPKTVALGETVYFDGTYVDQDAYVYLRIISPSNIHYGTVCYQGVIDWEYITDEVGNWRYEVLIDGNVQGWSKGTFTVTTETEQAEWYGLPYWVPYLIGVFITLFITMSPLIIATYITRKTKLKDLKIPGLLYVGFFFMGLVVSVMMNFLPSWLPFVILFGMIIYFSVQWLYGKKGAIEGE